MSREVLVAAYRPRAPEDGPPLAAALAQLAARLREEGMATERPALILRSALDDAVLLVLEWRSPHEERRAQDSPGINELQAEVEARAEAIALEDLAEASTPFATFEPVD